MVDSKDKHSMPATPDTSLGQALFSPRSIAIIGASDDPAKTSGRPVLFLRRAGFQGAIYPVNPRRDTVLGERAWPSLAALPEIPDHVYVLSPTETVIETIAECGRIGVPVATILASGFGEAGAEGAAREQELRRISTETRLR